MKWKIISFSMIAFFIFLISQGVYDKVSFVLYVGWLATWSIIFGTEWRKK